MVEIHELDNKQLIQLGTKYNLIDKSKKDDDKETVDLFIDFLCIYII